MLNWLEFRVWIVMVLPGQPSAVQYSTVLSWLRVNRMSCGVPATSPVKAPPPICVGPSP